jgi:hypothetical protein
MREVKYVWSNAGGSWEVEEESEEEDSCPFGSVWQGLKVSVEVFSRDLPFQSDNCPEDKNGN